MTPVFADTSYYAAVLSPKDALHEIAVEWADRNHYPIIVTEFVLLELGNSLRLLENRRLFLVLLDIIRNDPRTTLIPASTELLNAGLILYRNRVDKEWSVTDCISFVVMRERGLTEAVTADHHFQQAGFRALLR